jgi:hypothetical protein
MSAGTWVLILVLIGFPGLILFAVIYKYMEVKQASRWPSVPGRIVASGSQGREVSRGDANSDDTEVRTFALIEYEYTVANRKYRGSRVSIGENMGNFEVAETIARYPVGKAVTVYYNPNRREQAVLERDLPTWIWKAGIIIVLVLVGLIFGAMFGYGKLVDALTQTLPNPARAPFVAISLCFAAVAALFVFAFQRQASMQRKWPTVDARIENSGVHAFESRDSDSDRLRTQYRVDVVYSYEIAGVRYTGDKFSASQFSANTEVLARRQAERYPAGSAIQVHYNPANPAEAIVNPGGRALLLLLWLVPLAVVILAYVAATH